MPGWLLLRARPVRVWYRGTGVLVQYLAQRMASQNPPRVTIIDRLLSIGDLVFLQCMGVRGAGRAHDACAWASTTPHTPGARGKAAPSPRLAVGELGQRVLKPNVPVICAKPGVARDILSQPRLKIKTQVGVILRLRIPGTIPGVCPGYPDQLRGGF